MAEYAVIGLGRFGSSLARRLVERGHTALGIDRDMSLVQRYAHEITQTVALDATDEEALREVDILSYNKVIVAMGASFESALMTTVALKHVGVVDVIVKSGTLTHRDILLKVGATRVILPEQETGERLADELSSPGLVGSIGLCAQHSVMQFRAPKAFVGQSLSEAQIPGRFSLYVAAVVRGNEVLAPAPPAHVFSERDLLVLIGSNAALTAFAEEA